jgi:hypothetical protein
MSVAVYPKTNSDSPRYIRVEAIVITISEGNWNICVTEGYMVILSHKVKNKNVRG